MNAFLAKSHVGPSLTHGGSCMWIKCTLAFFSAAVISCLGMRLGYEHGDWFGWLPGATFTTLFGGLLAWAAFRLLWRSRPFLGSAAIGIASGIAGAGAYALLMHGLASMTRF